MYCFVVRYCYISSNFLIMKFQKMNTNQISRKSSCIVTTHLSIPKTYSSFEELEGKTLNIGDNVVIGNLKLRVQRSYFDCPTWERVGDLIAADIFKYLKLDPVLVASEVYGYEVKGYEEGLFPDSKCDDYQALTRMALYLFASISRAELAA